MTETRRGVERAVASFATTPAALAVLGASAASGSSSPAAPADAPGCSNLPAAIGSMTKQGVSLVTACLGYLRSGIQKQAADVETNVHTCTVLVHLTIVYEQGEDGWIVAAVPEVPGALSRGKTRAEARENVIDALRGILEPRFGEHASPAPADSESLELVIGG